MLSDSASIELQMIGKKISRRAFLQSLVAASATAGVELFSVPGFSLDAPHQVIVVGSDTDAVLLDLKTLRGKRIPIGFNAHSFIQHPQNPRCFIGIEKWGTSAAAVDFQTHTVKRLSSGQDYNFYGHGVCFGDRMTIFIARVDQKTGRGHLVGYNPNTYEIERDYQVTPGGLHQCRLLPDGNLMVTSSGLVTLGYGANPQAGTRQASTALIKIDSKTGKLLKELPISDPDAILAHFDITKNGKIVALCGRTAHGHRNGSLYFADSLDGPLRKVEWEDPATQPLDGEILSVAMNIDQSLAVVTCPISRIATLIDVNVGRVLKTIDSRSPWVAYDEVRQNFIGGSDQTSADAVTFFDKRDGFLSRLHFDGVDDKAVFDAAQESARILWNAHALSAKLS